MARPANSSRFLRFFHRSRAERRLLLRALFLLAITRVGLWILPYRKVDQWSRSAALRSPHTRGITSFDIDGICRAISSAAKFVPGASCLTQALVGQILLGQAGHAVEMQIGVIRKDGSPLQAHAWLEIAGRVVLGDLPHLSGMQPLRPVTLHGTPDSES
jgi:hypothetical protein